MSYTAVPRFPPPNIPTTSNFELPLDATGVVKLGLVVLLLISASRWQRIRDEVEQALLAERFLADERLNSYIIERSGPDVLQRARLTYMRLCETISTCKIVPPFIHYESRQMVAPKYGTAACVIYKNMSTVMTAIICYLFDVLDYQKNMGNIMEDTYAFRYCKGKNEYDSIRALDGFRLGPTYSSWLNIIIVRDPLERFISGFINKCLRETMRPGACYNCTGDVKCVMEKQYERLMGDAQKPSLVHTVEDAHFAPQTCLLDFFFVRTRFRSSVTQSKTNMDDFEERKIILKKGLSDLGGQRIIQKAGQCSLYSFSLLPILFILKDNRNMYLRKAAMPSPTGVLMHAVLSGGEGVALHLLGAVLRHCELRENLRKYKIIKYRGTNTAGLFDELLAELKKRGVGQGVLDDIREQVVYRRTIHQTYNSYKRVYYENMIRSSPYLMEMIVKMFYYDYLVFGYPLPQLF